MSKGGYKVIDQGGMQCKRLLLGNEMWAAKNRTFDIDLLLVGPELQTQDSATLRLEATKDSWGAHKLLSRMRAVINSDVPYQLGVLK